MQQVLFSGVEGHHVQLAFEAAVRSLPDLNRRPYEIASVLQPFRYELFEMVHVASSLSNSPTIAIATVRVEPHSPSSNLGHSMEERLTSNHIVDKCK